ncbi:MAG: hypothetical protein QNJ54_04270 [Prochloraceae cyanobacterium]|nr:hypothetical protein [Prochloraceae cyanobacterium]
MPLVQNWQELSRIASQEIAKVWLSLDRNEISTLDSEQVQANLIRSILDRFQQEASYTLPEGINPRVDRNVTYWKVEAMADGRSLIWIIPLPDKPPSLPQQELSDWADGTLAEAPLTLGLQGCC